MPMSPALTWSDGDLSPALADPGLSPAIAAIRRSPSAILLRHNGLHIELVIDRAHPIGKDDPAGLADVVLEAALSTIVDLEDPIAAVDAEDKVAAYANWLGLMKGDLKANFEKGGRTMIRALKADRNYHRPDGAQLALPGRSLLFVRNVGHLMTNPAILLADGGEAPEGILDGIVTSLIAHPRSAAAKAGSSTAAPARSISSSPRCMGRRKWPSPTGCSTRSRICWAWPRHTIKVGVMDEERRTSANLAACIAAVKNRLVFINTGFLDRTGDEIHTSMQAGAMVRKAEMKAKRLDRCL